MREALLNCPDSVLDTTSQCILANFSLSEGEELLEDVSASRRRFATMAHQASGDCVQIALLALILLALDGAAFPDR
jgi:hypothetical protein